MKKTGVLFLILLATLIIVSAQNQTIDEKAYSCLRDKVKDNCNKLTLEQQVFSLLALSDNSGIQNECKSSLLDKQKSDNSFGNVKDTSLAIIALNYIKRSTDNEEKWLLKNKKTADLEWYLEIEATSETKCKVDSSTITIKEDKKISGNPGSCLSLAYSNYWLRISDNCLDKNFTVSCDKDFISTLIYKKSGSNVFHVTSDVQSASASGTTEHQVKSYCFSSTLDSKECNYEASLWASLALSRTGNSISEVLPYLITNAENNENYFPGTFLYMLTSSGEYLNEILSTQKTDGSWKQGNNEYYDTALALLALYGQIEISNALTWLETKQGKDGCWNNGNIRDTGFLLWAAYPRTPVTARGAENNCVDFGYYCISSGECDEAQGKILDNFYCPGLKICCDTPALEKTCSELGGMVCPSGQGCNIATITDSEGRECCTGICKEEVSECESYGYNCRSTCFEDEQEDSLFDCPLGEVCCKKKPISEKSYLWIYLLVILIILVILGIIFRKRLRVLLFKIKSNFKKGPVSMTRPRFPPTGPPVFGKMFPSRIPIQRRVTTVRKPATKTDKELEETMKKLKEMSK